MIYFKFEDYARYFAAKNDKYEFIDFGEDAAEGRRYAVKVIKDEE